MEHRETKKLKPFKDVMLGETIVDYDLDELKLEDGTIITPSMMMYFDSVISVFYCESSDKYYGNGIWKKDWFVG